MIGQKIEKIKNKIENSDSFNEKIKKEFLKLIDELKHEIAIISKSSNDSFEDTINLAENAAHETTKEDTEQSLINLSLENLKSFIERFEISHPKLVETICSIA